MPPIDGVPIGPGGVVDLGAIRQAHVRGTVRDHPVSQRVEVQLGPTAQPCYKCPCCASWNDALNTFRAIVLQHDAAARRRRACPPGCQVCALAQGAYDAEVDDQPPKPS